MSKFTRIFESRGFKRTMAYVYGWGASAVILGALFKIMHWPGAGTMLTIGMTTEAIIFFLSAFEPLHVEPDWSLVYPELWGLYHPEEAEKEGWKPQPKKATGESISEKLDKMLEDAKIGPELVQSLADGMRNLSDNANKLSSIASAVSATDNYVANLNKASESVSSLANVYQQTAASFQKTSQLGEKLNESAEKTVENLNLAGQSFNNLSKAFQHDISANDELLSSIKSASQSAQLLSQKYQVSAEVLSKATEAVDFSKLNPSAFAEQLDKVIRNLSALNTIYESHNQQVQQQVEKAKVLSQNVDAFTKSIEETMGAINAYKEQANLLTRNLAALNTVYGNMLAAMNINRS
ncbi:MAG: gliding motility protein GldL [Bacteroidales bacterium]|nr:gliding motility protein GldL [Bacteroidales bacterium]